MQHDKDSKILFRCAARVMYEEGGTLEVDDDAPVLIVTDAEKRGAWVQCWQWVPAEEAGLE